MRIHFLAPVAVEEDKDCCKGYSHLLQALNFHHCGKPYYKIRLQTKNTNIDSHHWLNSPPQSWYGNYFQLLLESSVHHTNRIIIHSHHVSIDFPPVAAVNPQKAMLEDK